MDRKSGLAEVSIPDDSPCRLGQPMIRERRELRRWWRRRIHVRVLHGRESHRFLNSVGDSPIIPQLRFPPLCAFAGCIPENALRVLLSVKSIPRRVAWRMKVPGDGRQ